MADVKHWRVTYNDIHNLIRDATPKIATEFNPDLMIAIGKPSIILNDLDLSKNLTGGGSVSSGL